MLLHSRTTSGEKQLTDLNALAEEYLRLAYQNLRVEDKGFTCTIDTSYDQSLEKVEVVPQELGRVLLSLYNNAFYAVQQKQKQVLVQVGVTEEEKGYQPAVAVSTSRKENHVEIRVRDNGTGIPESVKRKFSQPFFTTKPTGKGLSLSYDIVMAHRGKIYSVSGEQSGTIIQIDLPLSAL